jgi:tetratricopeptide (TPR) repeat protein
MLRPLSLPLAALLAVTISLGSPETARAQAQPQSEAASPQDRADALFLQGKAAAQAKNWDEAHKLLAQAWQLKQSYDIASNLGQVAYLLGKHAEAAQHVSFALRHYPATGDAEQKQKAQDLLDLVRQKVSSLSFRVSPREAEVFVDGASVGSASALPPELFVEPGERMVTARLEGETVERHVAAKAGGHYNLELTLSNSSAAPVAAAVPSQADDAPAQPEDTPPPSDSAIQTKYIVIGVGAALTIGSGVALGIFASKRSKAESDIDTYKARVEEESDDPTACARNESQSCEDLAQAYDDWESSGRARNIFLGTTLTLFAGTVAAYFLWPSDSDEPSTTAITPVVTPEHQGLLLSGSF